MSIEAIGSHTNVWGAAMEAMRGQQKQSGQGMFEDMAGQLINDNDTDGDGLLSVKEMDISEDQFAELDTDGDGQVSSDEIATGLADHAQGLRDLVNPAAQFAQHLLAQFDADGDEALSFDESGLAEDDFALVDTDGDGSLSAEEIEASAPPPPPKGGPGEAGATMTQADSGLSSSTFSEMDTDGDGVVSQAELLAWMQKSQTSLAEIMDEEEGTEDASGVAGLFTSAMQAYQNQMDSILETLYASEAGTQALLESGVYGESLDMTI